MAENVFKLDYYQPQHSQAYSTPRKKPKTARHKDLPAVWVQSFGIWSRDDWQKVTSVLEQLATPAFRVYTVKVSSRTDWFLDNQQRSSTVLVNSVEW